MEPEPGTSSVATAGLTRALITAQALSSTCQFNVLLALIMTAKLLGVIPIVWLHPCLEHLKPWDLESLNL